LDACEKFEDDLQGDLEKLSRTLREDLEVIARIRKSEHAYRTNQTVHHWNSERESRPKGEMSSVP
jgi:hypothetical protein